MSISNIIDPTTRKIYPELIPPVPPLAVPNLNQVLTAGNSASIIGNPQTIENLDDLETGKVYQGNYLQLELGESGDTVLLKGTTALGTIHVGNGVSIEKLPVGANGLVLKANSASITGLGIEWAVDGTSGITGVSAGANITIDNTAPLTPAISLSSPLTSTLSLGTQSASGTTGSLVFTNVNVPVQSISQISAGGISSYSSVSGSQIATMGKSGFTTQDTSANLLTIAPTSIIKTGGTALSLTSAGGINVGSQINMTTNNITGTTGTATFTSAGQTVSYGAFGPIKTVGGSQLAMTSTTSGILLNGGSAGIQLNQPAGSTTLKTTIANVNYYPDTYLTNQNLNSVGVSPPSVVNSRLTLNNLGLTNTNQWSDYGNAVFAGYSAFTSDVNGNIWLAQQGSGVIEVWDITISSLLHTIILDNGGNPKSVEVFKQLGNFMFIGGSFNTINGNATPQYGITRVSTASYVEDPIYDSTFFINGTAQNAYVYAIEVDGSNDRIWFGGNFTSFNNGTNCYRIATFNNAQQAGGLQTYSEIDGGVGDDVYAIHYDNTLTNYLYVGGAFTTVGVNTSPQTMNYGAVYYPLGVAWIYPFCQNQLSSTVYAIIPSASTQYLFVAGSFANPSPLTGDPYSVYVEVVDAQNLYFDTGLTLATPPNQKQAYGYLGAIPPAVVGANIFHIESGFQVWTSLGTPTGAGGVSGINNFAGNWKVIYDGYGFVRSHQTLPHSCEFIGSFVYDALPYSKYIITTRNVSQQFVGDSGNTYWSIIGGGVGAFSN